MKLKIFAGMIAGMMATTTPAWADISAQEFLDVWRDLAASVGQELVIGSKEMVGDTLVLSNFGSAISLPEAEITVNTDWVKLRETGGSVEFTIAPLTIIQVEAMPKDGLEVSVTGILSQDGMKMLVSGSPEQMSIEFAANSYSFDLDRVGFGPLVLETVFNFGFDDIAGSYAVALLDDDRKNISGFYEIGQTTLNLDVKIPGGNDFVTAFYEVSDSNLTVNTDVIGVGAVQAMVKQGKNPLQDIDIAYGISSGASVLDVKFKIDGDHGALNWTQDKFRSEIILNPEKVAFGFSNQGGVISFSSSELPFPPVDVKFAEFSMDVDVPLAMSDAPSQSGLNIALRDIEVSDFLWSMFDPGKSLARDPVSAVLDLTGTIQILVDVMDLASIAQLNGPPALPVSLKLNELLVSAGGATLTGNGAVIFNSDNLELFDGLPQPIGSVDLSLRGGFGLLDKLTALGLVPQEASFGVRAMLGAFAKPGDEADHFTSKIELTEEGAILANGQRIK